MLKKYVSIVLSITMFLSSILVSGELNLKEVFAGNVISSFDTTFSYALTEGYTNGVPEKVTNTNNESALFSFSMKKDPNNTAFVQGKYVLSYPIKDGVILNLTVEKDGEGIATVIYDLLDPSGNSIDYTENIAKSSFTILSYNNGTYEKQANFSANGTVASGNYVVNKKVFNPTDSRDGGGIPKKAVFHITEGSGYSFEYGGVYADFRWDSITGNFEFYTEGLKNGNIYDVDLTYTSNSIPAPGVSETISIFTGMSLETGVYQGDGKIPTNGKFVAAPFANEYQFEKDIIADSTHGEGVIPGNSSDASEGTNGIRFGFTAPKVWNSATNAYDGLLDSSIYDLNLRMEIGGRQVNISKVMSGLDVTISGDVNTYIPSNINAIDSKGKFYFDLINLPIGVIYDSIEIVPSIVYSGTTTKVTEVKTKSSRTASGKVFTFPNYEVVKVNSQFYVKLTPFKKYNSTSLIEGTYLLKTDGNPSVTQWSDGKSEVYFPLPISPADSAGASYIYQIFFNPLTFFQDISDVSFNDYVHSQQYHYIVPLETGDIKAPENFEVVDYSLSATPGIDKKVEQTLSLELKYDIALKTQLDKMLSDSPNDRVQVRYSLSNYLTPSPSDPNKQEYAYVELDIYLGDYTDPDTGEVFTNIPLVNYTISYDKTFQDDSKVIKTLNGEKLEHEYKADSSSEVYYAQFPFELQASRYDATPVNDPIFFEYPNIYFLTVNAYEIDRDGDYGETSYVNVIGDSTFEAITLNDVTYKDVPPPQNIAISNVTKKSFDVTWELSGDGIRTFLLDLYTADNLKNIAKNIGQTSGTNNLDAYYNIYIGTSERYMQDTFSKYPLPDTKNDTSPNRIGSSYNINAQNSSQLSNQYKLDVTVDNNGTSKLPIDILRETNGIVMVSKYPIYNKELAISNYNNDTYTALQDIYNNGTNLENILSIDGLDKNKKYYVFADLVVENQETGVTRVITSSKLSPLVGETTLSDLDVPEDEYKIPPAPVLKLEEVSVDTAKLSWKPVVVTDSNGVSSQVEYDIISIQGAQMTDSYLNTKEAFSYTWENYLPADAVKTNGFRTVVANRPPDNILQYNPTTKTFEKTANADFDASVVTFLENGLTPNKVYFYYVRSVRVTKDSKGNEIRTYSTWSKISATTKNVQSPTNLKINTMYKTYDPQTEVVLNFDAPITDTSNIGVAYDFYYSYKLDGGTWSQPILMDAKTLISGATGSTATTTNFNYKVSKLAKGSNYTFKVKMIDKATGASSLYSNEAKAKTDLDQEDYDNDHEIDSWEDYILDKLKAVMNEPYWVIRNELGQKDIVYREEKFPGVISSAKDRFVTLVKSDDSKVTNYYIPASSYELLVKKGLGLKIIYKDTEFYLNSKTLADNLAEAKNDVTRGNTKDYYIKLSVSGYTSGAINGENTLSDIMTFSIETTGFKTTVKAFETKAYEELLALLVNNPDIKDLMGDIDDYVTDKKTDLQIQELVLKALPNIEKELLDEIYKSFKDRLAGSKYNKTINNLDSQLTINLLNVGSTTNVNGYQRVNNNWVLNSIISFGTTRTMTTTSTGVFVFTGSVLILPGLDNLDNADNIKDLFNKYGLTSYLGSGSTFNAENTLTGNMVMGSVAKILGMNSLDDPVQFLKSKDIIASERTTNTNIKSGDTIYYLMKIYEAKSGSKIENLNVTNYGATSNMTGLTSSNKKSVQIATQIGLITDPNFNANSQMTVKQFLEYLNKLDSIINF